MSVQETKLAAIADAIRDRDGTTAPIAAGDFPARIRAIPGGIELESIAITAPPAKTSYLAGESFDPAGMAVTATYSNGATLAATGYAVEPAGPLADGTTSVTVRYTEGGVSATAAQPITVVHRLTGISIGTPPSKTQYQVGEVFDPAGMVVLAAYSDGASAAVTGYTVPTSAFAAPGPQEVTVTYTENGVTAFASVAVTVARLVIETVPSQSGSLTYTGEALTPEWEDYDPAQLTLGGVTSAVDAGEYAATFTPTDNYQWSDGTTGAKAVAWSIGKAAGSVSLSPAAVTLDADHPTAEIQVTRAGDGAISAVSSDPGVVMVSVSGTTVGVSSVGESSGSATVTVSVAESDNHLAASGTAEVTAAFVTTTIYGVEWDWTDSGPTRGVRTDAAANFPDPSPAVNNGTGSSPFDNLMPWAGMVKETRAGGVEVKEPKYWFKWTKTGKKLKLQIADGPVDGFHVDPVNMDKGDGLGELDFSYIGRYHCGSDYKSTTNVAQKVNITRSAARSGIHGLGANFWQIDFAQFWYVGMLFLVEFADWNGERIGRGCSPSSSKQNNGKTDAMQYHTGTTAANRDTYGFTQYRNIEGWWDNVFDWMDGCYYNSNGLNVIKNPNQFSDNANGVLVGKPTAVYPSDFTIPTQSGLEWALFPCASSGSTTAYVPDSWRFNGSNPCLRHGGDYNRGQDYGPFFVSYSGTSYADDAFGCRLQERPPKAAQ